MAVRQLNRIKFAFLQRYSNSELYTLIFTDYKTYPTELTKVADLEVVAKTKISQVTDILGITRFTTLLDVFESVQQLREQALVAVVDEEAPLVDTVGSISEADFAAGYDAGGGGGG
jgi:hypothetical protein